MRWSRARGANSRHLRLPDSRLIYPVPHLLKTGLEMSNVFGLLESNACTCIIMAHLSCQHQLLAFQAPITCTHELLFRKVRASRILEIKYCSSGMRRCPTVTPGRHRVVTAPADSTRRQKLTGRAASGRAIAGRVSVRSARRRDCVGAGSSIAL